IKPGTVILKPDPVHGRNNTGYVPMGNVCFYFPHTQASHAGRKKQQRSGCHGQGDTQKSLLCNAGVL
ncbi:hypothetical protein, partial [Enterocloster citroniae]|uniref:hypothetical protein n=1 Tax=Enterocloster citroniae TaxID=358743 RepID=UPI0030514E73|nr:hypothetical protein [Enterocloster citroniae]